MFYTRHVYTSTGWEEKVDKILLTILVTMQLLSTFRLTSDIE